MLSLDKQNAWRKKFQESHPEWRPATERYADLVRQHLHPTTRLLDIGCGRGGLVEQLAHPLPQIVGVDPDWLSLFEHRLSLPRAAALSDDLPFVPESFDIAMASWVLEHLPTPLRTFQSIARVLKPGGVFVFLTPNGRHPLALLNRTLGKLGSWQGKMVARLYGRSASDTFATFYRANSPASINSLAGRTGLLVQALQIVPDPTYLAFNRPLFELMSLFENALPRSRKIHLVGVLQKPE